MPTFIQSVRTTDGFLKGAIVEFSPGLTCIIGARGTCKSTLVETIRFAFNCNPDRVSMLTSRSKSSETTESHPAQGLIYNTLGGGRPAAQLRNTGAHGNFRITVERELRRCAADLPRGGACELSDTSILQRLEIYSQGDLQLIAQDDKLRLDLIDRPHKARIDAYVSERMEQARTWKVGPKIRSKRIEIRSLNGKVEGLQDLRAQLKELQNTRPSLSEELERERTEYQARSKHANCP